MRYKDVKAMFMGQFEQVKEEQELAAEAKRQEEQARKEEAKKPGRRKSPPKKKRTSKTKAKGKGPEEVPQKNAGKLVIEGSASFSAREEVNAEGKAEDAE
jgi:FtsZ-interacting cell division protein YlmF